MDGLDVENQSNGPYSSSQLFSLGQLKNLCTPYVNKYIILSFGVWFSVTDRPHLYETWQLNNEVLWLMRFIANKITTDFSPLPQTPLSYLYNDVYVPSKIQSQPLFYNSTVLAFTYSKD